MATQKKLLSRIAELEAENEVLLAKNAALLVENEAFVDGLDVEREVVLNQIIGLQQEVSELENSSIPRQVFKDYVKSIDEMMMDFEKRCVPYMMKKTGPGAKSEQCKFCNTNSKRGRQCYCSLCKKTYHMSGSVRKVNRVWKYDVKPRYNTDPTGKFTKTCWSRHLAECMKPLRQAVHILDVENAVNMEVVEDGEEDEFEDGEEDDFEESDNDDSNEE